MIDGMDKVIERPVDRRSFLRGSAIFAAALGLSVASTAFAQDPPQKPEEKEKKTPAEEKEPPAEEEKPGSDKNSETKIDRDGREYRVCPQCASNMYRQGRTWTCENCGYSYVE